MNKIKQPDPSHFWAVVPAAGIGQRMKGKRPKQYLEIRGKLLIEHTIERLLAFPLLEKIVVVLGQEDMCGPELAIMQHEKIVLAPGGRERAYSVLNGLHLLSTDYHVQKQDWVMVHDAARPCIRQCDLYQLTKLLSGHAVGGLLGVPVTDTIKRTSKQAIITDTLDRSVLWHAQTPQMFRFGLLIGALEKAMDEQVTITDEASAVEYAGFRPLMVEGHNDNMKVTQGADLALASLYIDQQAKQLGER
ncbi:2-C-methyl-D-erythritol 4-phosphate cytidylyltransferase [invertebrate metagenome]|uniref:2-C-methyl-D-erythritol 4-phosphate cytidylyltransferase n=1 Tax=invertebrate metagenome TaxID=1711999 RepID=A0A2H9T964_9ZZZZ